MDRANAGPGHRAVPLGPHAAAGGRYLRAADHHRARPRRRSRPGSVRSGAARRTLTVERILRRLTVGNVYVNRNMIGAVVGTQPFGGSGLSGTGPKAGGPNYLPRFAIEQTIAINTAAVGGNASLLAEPE